MAEMAMAMAAASMVKAETQYKKAKTKLNLYFSKASIINRRIWDEQLENSSA
ncbi:hypothetical protein ACE6H2_019672 [Prunus campanulata]